MKNFSIVLAVVGGAIAGATVALLFAPQKGEDLRAQIKDVLKKKGLCCCDSQMDTILEKMTVTDA